MKQIKKNAAHSTTDRTAKATDKGAEIKFNKIDKICQIALESINRLEEIQKESFKETFGQTNTIFNSGVDFTYATIKRNFPTILKTYLRIYENEKQPQRYFNTNKPSFKKYRTPHETEPTERKRI